MSSFASRPRRLIDRLLAWPPVAFVKAVADQYNADDAPVLAAGLCYFTFFAVFPLLLGLIALFGLVFSPAEAQAIVLRYSNVLLPGQGPFLRQTVQEVVAARGSIGVLAMVTLLWSGKGIFQTLGHALDVIWEVPRPTGWWPLIRQNAIAVFMALAVGGAILALTVAFWVVHLVASYHWHLFGLTPAVLPLGAWGLVANLGPPALLFVALLALYRVLPSRHVSLGRVVIGAAVAALLGEATRRGFGWYLDHVARLNLVYGSVSGIIGFLLYLYLSAQVFLLGAEVADVAMKRVAAARRPADDARN